MSYGTKYLYKFYDIEGVEHRVQMKQRTWAASPTELKGGASPARVKLYNSNQRKFTPIRAKSAMLQAIFNQDNLGNQIRQDFSTMDDREWLAKIVKIEPGDGRQGWGEITSLNLTNQNLPATGSVTVTHVGSDATNPTCDFQYDIRTFAESQLRIFKVPKDEGVHSPNAVLLKMVPVHASDTMTDVTDRIVDANFTRVGGDDSYLRYEQIAFDPILDSGWNIKLEYMDQPPHYLWQLPNTYQFTGPCQREFIDLTFFNKQPHHPYPQTIQLARHYYLNGETIQDVITDLCNQVNGTIGYLEIQDVNFSGATKPHTIRIVATCSSDTITLQVQQVGALGNTLTFEDDYKNSTFIRLSKSNQAQYTYTHVNFSGGADGGDIFSVQLNDGSGWEDVASVTAFDIDTRDTIIERIVRQLNNQVWITASVDTVNSHKFIFYVDKAYRTASLTYQFKTDGASSLQDGGPAFTVVDAETVEYEGWIIPNFYRVPHIAGNVSLNFTATDGLGDLKYKKWSELTGVPQFGKLSLWKIIVAILQQTGFSLQIWEGATLWEENMNTATSPLQQVFVNIDQFGDKTLYTLLSELLFTNNLYITRVERHWELVPIRALKSTSYSLRAYTPTGTYIRTVEFSDFRANMGGVGQDTIMVHARGLMSLKPPYKRVEMDMAYGKANVLIRHPDFAGINTYLKEQDTDYVWRWQDSQFTDQNSFFGKLHLDSDGCLRMQDARSQNEPFSLNQYFKMSRGTVGNPNKNNFSILVELETLYGLDDGADFVELSLSLTDGASNNWYLSMDTFGNLYWSTNDFHFTIPLKEDTNDIIWERDFPYPSPMYTDGVACIQIHQPQLNAGYVSIKQIQILQHGDAPDSGTTICEYGGLVGGTAYAKNITAEAFEKTVLFGDVPDLPYSSYLYLRGLYVINDLTDLYDISRMWSWSETLINKEPILKKIGDEILKHYAIPLYTLQVILKGHVTFENILIDTTESNTEYMVVSGHKDLRINEAQLEIQRLDTEDDSPGELSYSIATNTNPNELSSSTWKRVPKRNYFEQTEGKIPGDQILNNTITFNPSLNKKHVALLVLLSENETPLLPGTDYSYNRTGANKEEVEITFIKTIDTNATYHWRVL